jgi:hypothetical protein
MDDSRFQRRALRDDSDWRLGRPNRYLCPARTPGPHPRIRPGEYLPKDCEGCIAA